MTQMRESHYWCHANTRSNHAFPWDAASDEAPAASYVSLCGVTRPMEILTYGTLRRCPLCEEQVENEAMQTTQIRKALIRVTNEATLGIEEALDWNERHVIPTTVDIFPPEGMFEVLGVRSFNGPGDVKIEHIQDGHGTARSGGPFDSASYAIREAAPAYADPTEPLAYYPAPWGVISREHPLRIRFSPYGTPSCAMPLRWTLYGRLLTDLEAGDEPGAEGLGRRARLVKGPYVAWHSGGGGGTIQVVKERACTVCLVVAPRLLCADESGGEYISAEICFDCLRALLAHAWMPE